MGPTGRQQKSMKKYTGGPGAWGSKLGFRVNDSAFGPIDKNDQRAKLRRFSPHGAFLVVYMYVVYM